MSISEVKFVFESEDRSGLVRFVLKSEVRFVFKSEVRFVSKSEVRFVFESEVRLG